MVRHINPLSMGELVEFPKNKKNGWEHCSQPLSLELCLSLFSKADSLLRTYACACTALCAEIRVDCLYWALANTCTACDAVVTNYVSHNLNKFYLLLMLILLSLSSNGGLCSLPTFEQCKDNNFLCNTYN